MLRNAVEASADDDGRANPARVGTHLSKQSADFDARNYGYARLSDLAEASGILDVSRAGEQNKVVLVKLRDA
ncbi:OST-HTH/LOTUS domain-containing protein [Rhizobium helianthi]|uniref:OST-HTH/LOTUS domain-containing protein n=1 Tax=Rhizobium helianthi TaxID=1132695 RepID=UPI003A986097